MQNSALHDASLYQQERNIQILRNPESKFPFKPENPNP
jgi:hypothetical protein